MDQLGNVKPINGSVKNFNTNNDLQQVPTKPDCYPLVTVYNGNGNYTEQHNHTCSYMPTVLQQQQQKHHQQITFEQRNGISVKFKMKTPTTATSECSSSNSSEKENSKIKKQHKKGTKPQQFAFERDKWSRKSSTSRTSSSSGGINNTTFNCYSPKIMEAFQFATTTNTNLIESKAGQSSRCCNGGNRVDKSIVMTKT